MSLDKAAAVTTHLSMAASKNLVISELLSQLYIQIGTVSRGWKILTSTKIYIFTNYSRIWKWNKNWTKYLEKSVLLIFQFSHCATYGFTCNTHSSYNIISYSEVNISTSLSELCLFTFKIWLGKYFILSYGTPCRWKFCENQISACS